VDNLLSDPDIREFIIPRIKKEYGGQLMEELGILAGTNRIDIAVMNDLFCGFEIKSDKDSLVRLEGQIKAYGQVFDRMVIITGEKFADKIMGVVPEWWGIEVVMRSESGDLSVEVMRTGQLNDGVDIGSAAELLWKREAIALLKTKSLHKGLENRPRQKAWIKIGENFTWPEVRECIKSRFRSRPQWQHSKRVYEQIDDL
jgi:hypothetical protein